ncbi:hypothetical protein ACLD9W_12400, partial [Neisseria sp. WLZKY-1]|uniref:hypothetical protein n=1 Tax=Neisseria sp. WLZKY-1 TaxID=3390377 RepID=UPI00397D0106
QPPILIFGGLSFYGSGNRSFARALRLLVRLAAWGEWCGLLYRICSVSICFASVFLTWFDS